jgi:hypothetical protein
MAVSQVSTIFFYSLPVLLGVAAAVVDIRTRAVWSLLILFGAVVAYFVVAPDSIGPPPDIEKRGLDKAIAIFIVLPMMLISYVVCFGVKTILSEVLRHRRRSMPSNISITTPGAQ